MQSRNPDGCLAQSLPAGGDADSCMTCHGGRLASAAVPANNPVLAQRAADLRAVNLAAEGDQAVFDELLEHVAMPLPSDPEIEAAGIVAFRDPPTELNNLDGLTVSLLLRALVRGEVPAIAWLHVGVEGLSLYLSQTRGSIRPMVTPPLAQWSWRDLTTNLPSDRNRLLFHLAGGNGPALPADTAKEIVANLPDLSPYVPAGSVLVVLHGSRRWPLLDRIAHDAGWAYGGVALLQVPNTNVGAVIGHLNSQAPLAHPYDLLLYDPSTAQNPIVQQPVFSDAMGAPTDVSVEVYAPIGMAGPVTLPFVMRSSGPLDTWPVVALVRAPLPRGVPTTLRVTLDDRAQVGLPDWEVEPDLRSLRDVLSTVPGYGAALPEVDLVFLVETVDGSGPFDQHRAAARLQLVKNTVWAIAREARSDSIRVGLIRYGQHRVGNRDLVSVVPLGSPNSAAAAANEWTLDPNINDLASALEDALVEVPRQPWRTGVSRILVTVGSRPPHPQVQAGDHAGGCSAHLRWEDTIAGLDAVAKLDSGGLVRVALHSVPDWSHLKKADQEARHRGERAWHLLGLDVLVDPGSLDVDDLLPMLGVTFGATTDLAYPVRSAQIRRSP